MASQNCSQCNAPLPMGPLGTIVTCRYCGAENTIDDPARKPPSAFPTPPTLDLRPVRATSNRAALIFGLSVTVIAGGIALAVNLRSHGSSSSGGASGSGQTRLPLSKLATLTDDRWIELEAQPLSGSPDAFELSPNVEWALAIGRAWSNDAVLARAWVDDVTREGRADLAAADAAEVNFEFLSPARLESAASLAQVSTDVPFTGLRLWVHAGKLEAMQMEYRGHGREDLLRQAAGPAPANSSCTLGRVLEIAAAHGLVRRPHYNLSLQPTTDGGRWGWTVYAADDAGPGRPPVLLDTCKAPAELPEPGAEDTPDDGMHEPFDWSVFRPVAGCECPDDPSVRLAVDNRSASFVKNRDGIEGSFFLAWILRAGEATPWRLPVDDRETAPSSVLWGRIEDSMAMACDGDRVFVVADGHASAWSRSAKRALWSVPAPVPPTATTAVPTEEPVEHGDFSLAFRCVPAALADGVLSVSLVDGTTLRLSAADGTAVPVPAADDTPTPATPGGESAPAPTPLP